MIPRLEELERRECPALVQLGTPMPTPGFEGAVLSGYNAAVSNPHLGGQAMTVYALGSDQQSQLLLIAGTPADSPVVDYAAAFYVRLPIAPSFVWLDTGTDELVIDPWLATVQANDVLTGNATIAWAEGGQVFTLQVDPFGVIVQPEVMAFDVFAEPPPDPSAAISLVLTEPVATVWLAPLADPDMVVPDLVLALSVEDAAGHRWVGKAISVDGGQTWGGIEWEDWQDFWSAYLS
jgi:hypothetical protein